MFSRFLLLLLAGLVLTTQARAIGGVWVLELSYSKDGKTVTGYFRADYGADHYTPSGWDTLHSEFMEKFGDADSVFLYSRIEDRELLAAAASFPMHPFEMVNGSRYTVALDDLKDLRLEKVWKRIDYMVNVLTPLEMSDTAWIGLKDTVEFPIGDDVGCRLEVHRLVPVTGYQSLIRELVELYQAKEPLSPADTRRFEFVLQELKAKRIVVVELCGC